MAKSVCVAYLFWLVGGVFGLHHLYLRRTLQCFLWLSTGGGLFGVGLLRDLFRMPEYVADCNEDADFMEKLKIDWKKLSKPRFSFSRFVGQVFFGLWFRNLVYGAIPEGFPVYACVLLPPIGTALGVYLVGNVGRQRGRLLLPLVVALATEVFVRFYCEESGNVFWSAVAAAIAFFWKQEHRKVYKKHSFCSRIALVFLGMIVVSSLTGSYLYFNCEFQTDEGEKIKLRDAVVNMLNSPAWREFTEALGILYQRLRHHGFAETFKTFIVLADVEGEQRSLEVLGLGKGATEADVKKAHKKLVVQYHPDKNREKGAADKFMEIQKAYETLTKIYKSRQERERDEPKAETAQGEGRRGHSTHTEF